MNFEEQILEAAKSIAAATSALVKAASAAQRELVAQGKVSTWIPRRMGTALLSTLEWIPGIYTPTASTGLSRLSSFLHRWAPFQPMHWMMGSGPKASFLL